MVLMSIVSYLNSSKLHSVYPSSLYAGGGGGGLSVPSNYQKGEAWQDFSSQISGSQRVVAGKDRGDFFQGVAAFYMKNKLKSEIFNDKKGL